MLIGQAGLKLLLISILSTTAIYK